MEKRIWVGTEIEEHGNISERDWWGEERKWPTAASLLEKLPDSAIAIVLCLYRVEESVSAFAMWREEVQPLAGYKETSLSERQLPLT